MRNKLIVIMMLLTLGVVAAKTEWPPEVFIVGVPQSVFVAHRARAAAVARMLNGDEGWAQYEHVPTGNIFIVYKCYQKPTNERILAMKSELSDAGVKWDQGTWDALLKKYNLRRVNE